MGTTRLRYTGYGLFLLVATGALLMAWMRLSFGLFLVIASTFAAFLVVFVVVRDGWDQTSTDNLNSRGIYPESDKIVVIFAGYKDRMDHFFQSNPGMRSRVAHHLDFAPYAVDELLNIGGLMLDQSSYFLSPDARATFRDYLSLTMAKPGFANARSVRNALEAARFRHARRLVAEPERHWTRDDLMRLEPSDIMPEAPALDRPGIVG